MRGFSDAKTMAHSNVGTAQMVPRAQLLHRNVKTISNGDERVSAAHPIIACSERRGAGSYGNNHGVNIAHVGRGTQIIHFFKRR
jgi:hypothetical protein